MTRRLLGLTPASACKHRGAAPPPRAHHRASAHLCSNQRRRPGQLHERLQVRCDPGRDRHLRRAPDQGVLHAGLAERGRRFGSAQAWHSCSGLAAMQRSCIEFAGRRASPAPATHSPALGPAPAAFAPRQIRIANTAGFGSFRLMIDGHLLIVTELDGLPIQPSTPVQAVRANAAQRVTVLVCPDGTLAPGKPAWIRAHMDQVCRVLLELAPASALAGAGSGPRCLPPLAGSFSSFNPFFRATLPPAPQSVFAYDAANPDVLGVLQYGAATTVPVHLPTTQPAVVDPSMVRRWALHGQGPLGQPKAAIWVVPLWFPATGRSGPACLVLPAESERNPPSLRPCPPDRGRRQPGHDRPIPVRAAQHPAAAQRHRHRAAGHRVCRRPHRLRHQL